MIADTQWIGRSIDHVLRHLVQSTFALRYEGERIEVHPKRFFFADYTTEQRHGREDTYASVDVGTKESRHQLKRVLNPSPGTAVGLMSRLEIDHDDHQYPLITNRQVHYAHTPMIDFDLDEKLSGMAGRDIPAMLKEHIVRNTEIEHGFLLQSGNRRHYHFLGFPELLTDNDLITFIGAALTMNYHGEEMFSLADTRHLGHALAPMKYMKALNPDQQWSIYDLGSRFLTLRITPRTKKEPKPTVIHAF